MSDSENRFVTRQCSPSQEQAIVDQLEKEGLTVIERREELQQNGKTVIFLKAKNFGITEPSPGRRFVD